MAARGIFFKNLRKSLAKRVRFEDELEAVEEVGVDIAEAIDILEIPEEAVLEDPKTGKDYQVAIIPNAGLVKKCKEDLESEKSKLKVYQLDPSKFKVVCNILDKNDRDKEKANVNVDKKRPRRPEVCPTLKWPLPVPKAPQDFHEKVSRIHADFDRSLSKEFQLSTRGRSSASALADMARNSNCHFGGILYRESVTFGHLKGQSQKCNLILTPDTIVFDTPSESTHVPLKTLQEVAVDEFRQVCWIKYSSYHQQYSEVSSTICLENFPRSRLERLILILDYLSIVIPGRKRLLILPLTWNFLMQDHKHPCLCAFPIDLTVEKCGAKPEMPKKSRLLFKSDIFEEGMEMSENNSKWESAYFSIKLNSLYLYENEQDELPKTFWLLTGALKLILMEREHIIELAFDQHVLLLKMADAEQTSHWLSSLSRAQAFEASNYFDGETVIATREVFVGLTAKSVATFNMEIDGARVDKNHEIVRISQIMDVVPNDKICSLVFQTGSGTKMKWKLGFQNRLKCLQFVKELERLWKID